ncbi:type II CAAX endopeptidase family protein [Glutamicibacter protophormiae]|uniref:CPBP family intramembrane glutamic endopeptidase n=1 Tax=Glutamicibacter protophormiae TaxID=37930 RepID=UPI002A830FB8|nr:type II CAAX endopeptidase family protein [Glutamicibacter protophormiae]WPR64306.1 type II CAAX endopeptidase family protein [Glutamicibacter protophormiae]WPR67799.1 type II CAAX endopeptidase family protein [Glutamicibacter protophormiae]
MHQLPEYPSYPVVPRHRQRVFDAGRFTRGDLFTVLAYIVFFVLGGAGLIGLIPGYVGAFETEQQALFGINLILYVSFFVLAMIQCGPQFFDSFKTMRYYPWAKWLMLPGGWLVTIISTAVISMLVGQVATSENQAMLEEMSNAVPLPVMLAVTALFGPFVEEYLFRHLLIGKLSRKLNVWVCAAISVLAFASIHFIGSGIGNWTEILPYLMLGVMMSVAYILSGKSMAYAYMLHVINNAIALLMVYLVYPLLPQGI